ncbi:MAG: efflux RND transporter periplasmic adaptor subunit [Streptosporangiaceae bacterium]
MSSTGARERADEPAAAEQFAPGRAEQSDGQALPGRRGGGAASGPVAGELLVAGHRRRRRGWIAVAVVVVVAAAGAAGADAAGAFRAPKQAVSISGYGTRTVPVRQGSLTEQMQENGTLGDAGIYSVVVPGSSPGSGAGGGTFTWLPSVGQVIRQGQMIYQVSGTPVVLLYGNVPAYRDLSEGMTGADVTELNTDLVSLGYATATALGARSGWDYFSGETAYALGLLQAHVGLSVTGNLPLGQAVVLPGEIQITGLGTGVVPGAPATSGAVVLTGTSLTPVVTVNLDASLQAEVAAGNKVSITLPDGSVTPGVISQISTASVLSSSSSSSASGNGSGPAAATITVEVSLTDPAAAGNLTQAPVEVTITTGSVSNVLIVPVDALLARPGGGYAVEVTGPGGHRLVTVTPGMFDDAAGTVQVTGHLTPGQRVVVPGI